MSRAPHSPMWYGKSDAMPYLSDTKIFGNLIVIEGPDASGRSTQIELLTTKLEAEGFAVLNTGLKRSALVGTGILKAKQHITLGKRTVALYYAADFADQLEQKIIPALRSGYIVLADRYIYTLMARNTVRGIGREWSSDLYNFALVPDLVFYLDVDPLKLVHRVFKKHQQLDYYESGSDMRLSDDMFESFVLYQQRMAQEFKVLKKKYGLFSVDGNQSIKGVYKMLVKHIVEYLNDKKGSHT